ncbi:extensin family protein [Paraburkholderia sp. MPAMCS5]|uniref:extensin-like domain-containing protein n=1 Tax=Paraburkholderia sp. MPAMCS5 TaxID=3112563 RepID=UPI002E18C1A8|nr:extensin family protein [Paraburkholderia sp. MPAMCS5]
MRHTRLLALLLTASLIAVLAWLVAGQRISISPRWDPFAPLDVQAPLGPLTPWRLWRATHDPIACRSALNTAHMTYIPVPDQTTPSTCQLQNVLRVERFEDARPSSSFLATCPLALALAMYERHYLQPAAQAIYGESVRQIVHVGSYACRNVNHEAQGPLSEHAFANAIDIEGFVLADGSTISVAHDWSRDTRAGAFVRRARNGACAVFHTVLGPDYNALHRAHFHVDMGPYRVCS